MLKTLYWVPKDTNWRTKKTQKNFEFRLKRLGQSEYIYSLPGGTGKRGGA